MFVDTVCLGEKRILLGVGGVMNSPLMIRIHRIV